MTTAQQGLRRGLLALPLLAGIAVAQPALAAHQVAKHKTYIVKEEMGSSGFIFSPSKLTIHVGDTVRWIDVGQVPHDIIGTNKAAQGLINRQDVSTATYSVAFKKAGTFTYECNLHLPSMVGTIIVKK